MIFTQEQINEIKKRLALAGIKDTQFPVADFPFKGDETFTIVQKGVNKKMSIDAFTEELLKYVHDYSGKDLFNVSEYMRKAQGASEYEPITLETAVANLPEQLLHGGQIITFWDGENWVMYQYYPSSETWEEVLRPEDPDIKILPKCIDVIYYGNVMPLGRDGEANDYAIVNGTVYKKVSSSWVEDTELSEEYFYFRYNNKLYEFREGTINDSIDFTIYLNDNLHHIYLPYFRKLEGVSYNPPTDPTPGYYLYYTQEESWSLHQWTTNNGWELVTPETLAPCYFLSNNGLGNTVYEYRNGQLSAGVNFAIDYATIVNTPTIGDANFTIKYNGRTLATFSANSTTNIELDLSNFASYEDLFNIINSKSLLKIDGTTSTSLTPSSLASDVTVDGKVLYSTVLNRFVLKYTEGVKTMYAGSWNNYGVLDSYSYVRASEYYNNDVNNVITPKADILYYTLDSNNNVKFYLYNGNTLVELEVGGGTHITIDKEIINLSSENVPTTKAVVGFVNNAINNADLEGNKGWGEPDFTDPLRPEYYYKIDGQNVGENPELIPSAIEEIKWGIAFYDWPLRCYNGVSDYSTVTDTYEGSVFAPSERILYNMYPVEDLEMEAIVNVNTFNVKYNVPTKSFVLVINDGYRELVYANWNNADEWNDYSVNPVRPRKDRLFSDISKANPEQEDKYLADIRYFMFSSAKEPEEIDLDDDSIRVDFDSRPLPSRSFPVNIAQRTTKVFGWEGSDDLSEDIGEYMTDFSTAFEDCIVANGGSMRLSNRIYYIGNVTADNLNTTPITLGRNLHFDGCFNFEVDGGKGVIFVRRASPGVPPIGTFVNFRHGTANTYKDMSTVYTYNRPLRGGNVATSTSSRYILDDTKLKNALSKASKDANLLNKNIQIHQGPESTDSSTALFVFRRCGNGVIKNITFRTLRDADNGAPSGHLRFSCSDSRINAFSITKYYSTNSHVPDTTGVTNLTFENIDIKGAYQDFNCSGASESGQNYIENITINGWKSDSIQNSVRGYNWKVSNAIIHQPDYIGSGLHIIYSQGTPSRGIFFKNCEFKQGKVSSVMITYHGAKQSRDWHFTNCSFYGELLFQGKDISGWTTFDSCYFEQTGLTAASDENNHTQVEIKRLLGSFGHNIVFNNCRIYQLGKYLVHKGNNVLIKVNSPAGNPFLRGYYEATFTEAGNSFNADETYYIKVGTEPNEYYREVTEEEYEEAVEKGDSSPKKEGWYVVSGKSKTPDTKVDANKYYYLNRMPHISLFNTGITVPAVPIEGNSSPTVTDSSCLLLMQESELNYEGTPSENRSIVKVKTHYDYVTTKDLTYLTKECLEDDFNEVWNKVNVNKNLLLGDTNGVVNEYDNLPITALLDECYYVIEDNSLYTCSEQGTNHELLILVYDPESLTRVDGDVNFTIILSSKNGVTTEGVEGILHASTTMTQEDIFEQIFNILLENGYKEQLWHIRDRNNRIYTSPGTFARNGNYFRIKAKNPGSGGQVCYTVGGSYGAWINSNGIKLSCRTTSVSNVGQTVGTDSVFPAQGSGIPIPTRYSAGLEGRVTNLEKFNSTDTAPDLTDVPEGFCFFDTSDNKPYWKAKVSTDPDTYAWVDATGTERQ